MVTTTDPDLAARIAALRNHGAIPDPAQPGVSAPPWKMGRFEVLGYNLRLSDIQAAVGLAQLAKLDDLLRERRQRARRYDEILPDLHGIALPVVPAPATHTFQTYVVRVLEGGVRRRNAIMEFLQAEGIQTRPGTHAVHRVGYYVRRYGLAPDDFARSAEAEDTTIALPLFPGMTDADQERVAATMAASLRVRVP